MCHQSLSFSVHETPSLSASARTSRLEIMESTPLLPQNNKPSHDHPIFFRVCHSPWIFLGQKSLLLCRALLAAYMVAIVIVTIHYAAFRTHHGQLFIFFAGQISYITQTVYHLVTTVSFCSGAEVCELTCFGLLRSGLFSICVLLVAAVLQQRALWQRSMSSSLFRGRRTEIRGND